MLSLLKTVFFAGAFSVLCQTAIADTIYQVTLDTAPLVGHPAGPFYVYAALTDGSGIGDANNTVTLSNFTFGGGSALGSPIAFGGASGSLENGVAITDSSFLSFFVEQFVPGQQLSFSLRLSSNEDGVGIPDRFTFFFLDSSGVPLPTLAPFGDYFLGVDLGPSGPILNAYGSDASRSPTVGNAVSIPPPTALQVVIQINPPSVAPASFNIDSEGAIPVAILGGTSFNVTTIDPTSVKFGPKGAKNKRPPILQDVNKDGKLDMILYFAPDEARVGCYDTSVVLTGETFSNQQFSAVESINSPCLKSLCREIDSP